MKDWGAVFGLSLWRWGFHFSIASINSTVPETVLLKFVKFPFIKNSFLKNKILKVLFTPPALDKAKTKQNKTIWVKRIEEGFLFTFLTFSLHWLPEALSGTWTTACCLWLVCLWVIDLHRLLHSLPTCCASTTFSFSSEAKLHFFSSDRSIPPLYRRGCGNTSELLQRNCTRAVLLLMLFSETFRDFGVDQPLPLLYSFKNFVCFIFLKFFAKLQVLSWVNRPYQLASQVKRHCHHLSGKIPTLP